MRGRLCFQVYLCIRKAVNSCSNWCAVHERVRTIKSRVVRQASTYACAMGQGQSVAAQDNDTRFDLGGIRIVHSGQPAPGARHPEDELDPLIIASRNTPLPTRLIRAGSSPPNDTSSPLAGPDMFHELRTAVGGMMSGAVSAVTSSASTVPGVLVGMGMLSNNSSTNNAVSGANSSRNMETSANDATERVGSSSSSSARDANAIDERLLPQSERVFLDQNVTESAAAATPSASSTLSLSTDVLSGGSHVRRSGVVVPSSSSATPQSNDLPLTVVYSADLHATNMPEHSLNKSLEIHTTNDAQLRGVPVAEIPSTHGKTSSQTLAFPEESHRPGLLNGDSDHNSVGNDDEECPRPDSFQGLIVRRSVIQGVIHDVSGGEPLEQVLHEQEKLARMVRQAQASAERVRTSMSATEKEARRTKNALERLERLRMATAELQDLLESAVATANILGAAHFPNDPEMCSFSNYLSYNPPDYGA